MKTVEQEIIQSLFEQGIDGDRVQFDFHFPVEDIINALSPSIFTAVEPTDDPKVFKVRWVNGDDTVKRTRALEAPAPPLMITYASSSNTVTCDDVFPEERELLVRFTWYPPRLLLVEILFRQDRVCMFEMSYIGNLVRIEGFQLLDAMVELKETVGQWKGVTLLAVLDYMHRKRVHSIYSMNVQRFFSKLHQPRLTILFYDDCSPHETAKLDPSSAYAPYYSMTTRRCVLQNNFGQEQLSDLLFTETEITRRAGGDDVLSVANWVITASQEEEQENIARIFDGQGHPLVTFKYELLSVDPVEIAVTFPNVKTISEEQSLQVVYLLCRDFLLQLILYSWTDYVVPMEVTVLNMQLTERQLAHLSVKLHNENMPFKVAVSEEGATIVIETNWVVGTDDAGLNDGRRRVARLKTQLEVAQIDMDNLYFAVIDALPADFVPPVPPLAGIKQPLWFRQGELATHLEELYGKEPMLVDALGHYNEKVMLVGAFRRDLHVATKELRELVDDTITTAAGEPGQKRKRRHRDNTPESKKSLVFRALLDVAVSLTQFGVMYYGKGTVIDKAYLGFRLFKFVNSFMRQ